MNANNDPDFFLRSSVRQTRVCVCCTLLSFFSIEKDKRKKDGMKTQCYHCRQTCIRINWKLSLYFFSSFSFLFPYSSLFCFFGIFIYSFIYFFLLLGYSRVSRILEYTKKEGIKVWGSRLVLLCLSYSFVS